MDQDKQAKSYWEWMEGRREGQTSEDSSANPDQVAEWVESSLSEEDQEKMDLYWELVDKGIFRLLSKQQRKVWKLKFVSWISEDDIAKRLGVQLSTVRSHLSRAGAKIRKEMLQHGDESWERKTHLTNGFKKGIDTAGETPTDKPFAERMKKAKKEIRDFYKEHPEIEREQ